MKNTENNEKIELSNTKKNTKNKDKKKKKNKKKLSSNEDSEESKNSKKDKVISEAKKDDKQNRMVYNDRFEIQTSMLLGRGSFGEIYITYDTILRNYCALKLESQKNKHPQLKTEKMVFDTMAECDGFPKLIEFGTQNDYNYMAMEILGPNLSDLFDYCHHKFSLQTVLLIAIQLLSRLQELHAKNYIHRDIKPENFLIGVEGKSNLVYMIDFGLSRKYKDPKTMDHIPYRENRPLTGTARYASINTHLGIEQSRRDDLEAVGYVLIYFLKKRLPWQGCQGSNKQDKYNKILEKKLSIPTEILCKDLPLEFSIYMNYVKNIRFDERPDYNFLKGLFIDLLFLTYNEKFMFDWTLPNLTDEPPNKKKLNNNNNNDSIVSNSIKDELKVGNSENSNSNTNLRQAIDKKNSLINPKGTISLNNNNRAFSIRDENINPGNYKFGQNNDIAIDFKSKNLDISNIIKENEKDFKVKHDNELEKIDSDTESQKTYEHNNFDGNEFVNIVNKLESISIDIPSEKNSKNKTLNKYNTFKKEDPVLEVMNEDSKLSKK